MPAMYVPRYSVPGCAGSTASACMIPPCGPSEVHDVARATGATAILAATVTHVIHVRARDRGIAGPSRRAPYPAGRPGVNEKRPRSASAAAELREPRLLRRVDHRAHAERRNDAIGGGNATLSFPSPSRLDESVVRVAAGEGAADDGAAERVRVVGADRELLEHVDRDAQVDELREVPSAVGGRPAVAEEPARRRAAALVPEVVCLGDLEPVPVGADRDAAVRLQEELGEDVARVHEVVERELRVDARRREELEECLMLAIVGIVVARGTIPADAQPG